MNGTLHRIKCAHCKGEHQTIGEVKDCARGVTPAQAAPPAAVAQSGLQVTVRGVVYSSAGATQRQVDYVNDLGGDPVLATKYTKIGCSGYIKRLQLDKSKQPIKVAATAAAPEPPKTKIPLPMLMDLREGYYASRPDSDHEYTFFRVSWPKRGNFKGALKIQTQHGPDLKLYMVVWPGGRVYLYNKSSRIEEDLLLVTVDMRGCGIAYAEKIGNCMRCNTELTDARSRWYGIGPECEKHWPEIIDEINEIKGVFKYGSDS